MSGTSNINSTNTHSWAPAVQPSSTERSTYNGHTATVQKEGMSQTARKVLKSNTESTGTSRQPLLSNHRLAAGPARPQVDARVTEARVATSTWVKAERPSSEPNSSAKMQNHRTEEFQKKLAKNEAKLEKVIKETIDSEQSYRNDLNDLISYFDVALNDPDLEKNLKAFNQTLDPNTKPLTRESLELAKKHYTEARDSSQQMQSLMPKDQYNDASFVTSKAFMDTFNSMTNSGTGEIVLGYDTFHINVGEFLKSQTSVQSHIKTIEAERQASSETVVTEGGKKTRTKEPMSIVNQPIQRLAKYQLLAREMAENSPDKKVQIESRIGEIINSVDKLDVGNSYRDIKSSAKEITKGKGNTGVWDKFQNAYKTLIGSNSYKKDSNFRNEINREVNVVFRHNLNQLANGGFFQRISLKVDLFFGSMSKQEFKESVEHQINFIQKSGFTANTDEELFKKARAEVDQLTK